LIVATQKLPAGNLPPDVEDVYPLSPMQEGMLFHTLMQPGSGIYLMQNRYRIEGELQPEQFREAWRRVIARHSVLRSSFVWKTQKRPLQVVHRKLELPFELIDVSAESAASREQRIEAELARERAEGFAFGKAPLMRVRLFRLERGLHEFVHSFHHILLDEWCTSLVMLDFLRHYQALVAGRELELGPAPSYRSYIDWIQRQDLAAAQRFFRQYLQGFTSATPLGLEPARERGAAAPVADLALRLDRQVSARLVALAQQHRLTLNTLVQGAWALLSSRYGGTRDVLFGVTVAGRPPELPGVEEMVGLFINTLPLRVSVPPDALLLPWLSELLQQNLRLRQYEYTPLVDVQSWSQLEKGQPLFNSLFVFESAPIAPVLRDGRFVFTLRDQHDRVHTNYPITAMAWPDTEIGLKLSRDTRQIDEASAGRMLAHLKVLLESMAERPDARLGELGMLTSPERHQALELWNATAGEREELSSLAARFEAQVELHPDASAVACGSRSVSYRELNRLANRVAHVLQQAGVGPESRVLVMDERGIELIALLLGVFKAGAAYVPIEPDFPLERVTELALRARPAALLTRARLAPHWRELSAQGSPLFTLEQIIEAPVSEHNPAPAGGERSLAYVIYTSGSTGVPKGVMIERRGMLANMLSKLPLFRLGPGDVVAQTASIAFDISVWQMFTALLVGGRVEVVPRQVAADPARLLACVEQTGVNVLEVVPAVLQGLLDAAAQLPQAPRLAQLRAVLPTGEALPAGLARAWLQRYPGVPLFNAYGPAECSDDVSLQRIDVPPAEAQASVSIGSPTPHGRLYVRAESDGEPLPVGVCGELYVGGIGVGRGYLGDPRRTAELFLPDPFATERGQRLYRTGDLVRQRDDGSFDFVGRRDQQVKIRGYRIELGEIEARLAAHPALGEVVVAVREDRPGQRRLVAYLVASAAPPSNDELRSWLAQRLPEYMLPSGYVWLGALPRSANGKLLRSGLPAPEGAGSVAKQAPRSDTEQRLAGIWRELLGVPEVGVEDSFFALGGHSLLLTQVLARVRRVFELEPPLAELFQAATLAEQAQVIERAREQTQPTLPALLPLAQPTGQLSFAQERLWFTSQLEAASSSLNVPGAVRLRGPLDVARLEQSLGRVVARQAALRTRFIERDGRPEALVEAQARVPLELVVLTHLPAAERQAAARRMLDRKAAEPFELSRAPLLRALLARLDEQEHVLLLVLHHIISDGWSLQLLVRELVAQHSALQAGTPDAIPPLGLQYSDYVAWQRSWLTDAQLERQLAFWRRELGPEPPVLALRTDHARPAERTGRGARLFFQLDVAHGQRLLELARCSSTTPFMILLAAFHCLLARYSGQTDICVGTPVAQRTREETEPLIGLFVNTLVVRLDAAGALSFADLLGRVRERVLAVQAHQDMPFERLVQELRVRRDLARTPLFQALFSLDEGGLLGGAGRIELPASSGLEVQSWEVDPGAAQFDLSLHVALEGTHWSGAFEYASDLFQPATVAHMTEGFCALLAAVLQAPHTPLAQLPLPAAPELAAAAASVTAPAPVPPPASEAAAPAAASEVTGSRALLELSRIWAEVLGVERVSENDNFFELGGDSILSLQVVARARRAGLRLRARDLFQHQTLAALARASELAAAESAASVGRASGPAVLGPIQRRFFERALPNPHHHNQTLLLRPRAVLSWPALERALGALSQQHAALRLRYTQGAAGWFQEHASEAGLAWSLVDLSAQPREQRRTRLEAQAARWQASLDLAAGPLFRAVGFELGEGEQRLLLIAHHLVVDAVSWRVLLDDLAFGYEAALRSAAIELGSPSASFQDFTARLQQAAAQPELLEQARHWLALPWREVARLPVDHPDGSRAESQLAEHLAGLDEVDTARLLQLAAGADRSQIEPLLLTALALALARWAATRTSAVASALAIELEGHGRDFFDEEELDVARSVGWFTNVYPVVLSVEPTADAAQALASVQRSLVELPRQGLPYALARHLASGDVSDGLRALPAVEVGFNYLGQWDQLVGEGAAFALAPEAPGPERSPDNPLAYELEVDVAVYERKLEATLRYSRARFEQPAIAELGAQFSQALRSLIELRGSIDLHGAVRGAEPAAREPAAVVLSATELDALLGQMD
jgi:amino acid adenylation domain-containing protein/non-ribosomal peptide synthase protein (TIGR01720 family)